MTKKGSSLSNNPPGNGVPLEGAFFTETRIANVQKEEEEEEEEEERPLILMT